MKNCSSHRQQGVTLLELMIVVTVIGIITSLTYPAYQQYIINAQRSTAQADLMAFAAAMERHRAARFSYQGAASGGINTGVPAIFLGYSPASESAANKVYDLTIDAVNDNGLSYVLRATPLSGANIDGDGDLLYFSDGRKGWDKDNNGSLSASEYCWKC